MATFSSFYYYRDENLLSGLNFTIAAEDFVIIFNPGETLKENNDYEIELKLVHKDVIGISVEVSEMKLKAFKFKKDEDFLNRIHECSLKLLIQRQGCCCNKYVYKLDEFNLGNLQSNFMTEHSFDYDPICAFKIQVQINKPCIRSEIPEDRGARKVIELVSIPISIINVLSEERKTFTK